jgi:serine/threonine protein kinase
MTPREGPKAHRNENHLSGSNQHMSDGKYRDLLPIGSGGSANINIAVAEGVGNFTKLVVLKTIRPELLTNAAASQMFLDEARLSARMNHPNVVQVYEVFLRRDVPVIVMEFLDGQPLSYILAQSYDSKALTLDVSVSILTKVLAGLQYAHTLTDYSGEALGLIHRDVSPHNVMVTYDGQVKLVDFGIAKLSNSEHQTRTGVIKGKLTYMAPEQFTGKVDSRADIFGVGVMLWELATRQRYWGDLPEPALIGRLISGDLPHLRKPTSIDDELYRICAKALSFRPSERYESASAMQEDLERYLAKRGAILTQVGIGKLVTETCSEARRKVQTAIREQLSKQGLSVTGIDASRERLLGKTHTRETMSGERLRRSPGRDATTGGLRSSGKETTTGGLRAKNRDATGSGGLRPAAVDPTTTGGLRAKAEKQGSTDERFEAAAEPPPDATASPDAPAAPGASPLRLFGGVAPTARVGVALAGFGTLAVLILALGLSTPDDPAAKPAASNPSAATTPAPLAPGQRLIRVSANPPEASWFLDDQKLDSNPVEITIPTDGALHTLRAEAPGFKPFIKSVRLDADIDITIALTRE